MAKRAPSSRRGDAHFVAAADSLARLPPPTVAEVAFAGRSNVGKSSLLNRLVGRRALARVGKTPGRTQQINFFALGGELILVDLPGYGFARVPLAVAAAWRRLVESYLRQRETLCGVVLLIDARRGVGDEDAALVDYLAANEIACCIAATKVDKLKRSERARLLKAMENDLPVHAVIACSATTGEGVAELWRRIDVMVAP